MLEEKELSLLMLIENLDTYLIQLYQIEKADTFSDHTVKMFNDIPKYFTKAFTCENGK